MASECIIVSGGEPPHDGVRSVLPATAFVIVADSGLDHAEGLGLHVDLVVGDLDSVSTEALERARRAGIEIDEHPMAKDETDLELALAAACARGYEHLVVVSGGGGRLDHLLAGVLVLVPPAALGVAVEAWIGSAWVAAVHGPANATVRGRPGELLTLLAVGGPAEGVVTDGLRYPLHHETLLPGSGRGVSNELVGSRGSVALDRGDLLVVRPHALVVPA